MCKLISADEIIKNIQKKDDELMNEELEIQHENIINNINKLLSSLDLNKKEDFVFKKTYQTPFVNTQTNNIETLKENIKKTCESSNFRCTVDTSLSKTNLFILNICLYLK